MQLLKATAFVMLPCRSTMHTVKKKLQIFRSIRQSRWSQYLRVMGITKRKKKVVYFLVLFIFCIWYLCKCDFVMRQVAKLQSYNCSFCFWRLLLFAKDDFQVPSFWVWFVHLTLSILILKCYLQCQNVALV